MNYAATEKDVDVFMSGFAFRLKIMHDRGLSLLNGQRKKLFPYLPSRYLHVSGGICNGHLLLQLEVPKGSGSP